MYVFKFADIGEGLHEGQVGEIYVKEGQEVKEGDSLFSVETDKVTSDIPAPTTGKIAKILIKTGETVHVGDEIFHIDDGSGAAPAVTETKEEVKEETKSESVSEGGASVVGSIEVSDKPMATFTKPAATTNNSGRVFATPYARALAKEKGIDINTISGSGENGRVLATDVLSGNSSVSVGASSAPSGSFAPLSPFSQPITNIRKAIAKAMKNSWDKAAYTSLTNEVNMTRLWDERVALNKVIMAKYDKKISFTALTAMAVIHGLREFPIFNSKADEAAGVIKHDGVINLGIAVDTPQGLFVPVIKNAHTKNILDIASEIAVLAKKAKDGKLTMDDMSGATFTITNFGTAGILFGVPVINYPELAILGTGAIIDRVLADKNGSFYNGKIMNLSLTADHRWVDGADIGRFITYIKDILENPILILGGY